MGKSVCFTGHRPGKLAVPYDENCTAIKYIKSKLSEEIQLAINDGYTVFYTGMAAGVDIIAAEIVLEYQKKYTDLELLCIIPFHAQYSALKENMWRVRYKNIIAHETKHIILSEDYYDGCFLDRNRYMVDNTSRVIAVWNGQSSGTSSTVRYGQRTGREVKIISI